VLGTTAIKKKEKIMNKIPPINSDTYESDDLLAEYNFDYSQARPNRFALRSPAKIRITLDPDVAEVFQTSESVNRALRCLLAAIPKN
jgi:hypothetical protein